MLFAICFSPEGRRSWSWRGKFGGMIQPRRSGIVWHRRSINLYRNLVALCRSKTLWDIAKKIATYERSPLFETPTCWHLMTCGDASCAYQSWNGCSFVSLKDQKSRTELKDDNSISLRLGRCHWWVTLFVRVREGNLYNLGMGINLYEPQSRICCMQILKTAFLLSPLPDRMFDNLNGLCKQRQLLLYLQ